LFLKLAHKQYRNSLKKKMNHLNLPPEVLRVIAMNLDFEDLGRFQESSENIMAATSDVSFYYRYFTENYDNNAIEMAYSLCDKIPCWKSVVGRLMRDNFKFAKFFYANTFLHLKHSNVFPRTELESELERLGREIGNVFRAAVSELCSRQSMITIDTLNETVSKLRQENSELSNTEQWPFFEDCFYAEFFRYMSHGDPKIDEPEDVEVWLDILHFAVRKNFKTLQDKIASHIIDGIFHLVASGSMEFEKGLQQIQCLMQKLLDLTQTVHVCRHMVRSDPETLPGLARLYEFLVQDVMQKRKFNYIWFYQIFVLEMVKSISFIIGFVDDYEPYLSILKSCLQWRFAVPDGHWRSGKLDHHNTRICIIDEELRDIFYPHGFILHDDGTRDITSLVYHRCSLKFMKACEGYLYCSENVDEQNSFVLEAREACKRMLEWNARKSP
jgi:hypothetical protein